MDKNDGGNKGKGLARKHVTSGGSNKQLRVATEDGERYAVVSKMLGNGMCYVRLLSGGGGGNGGSGDKLCIIRNKFKGRGKRDNILDSGSWVLVGLREWASKQDTCDLLEVYNDSERDRLMKNEPCFKAVASTSESNNERSSSNSSSIQFTDSETIKYSKLVKSNAANNDDDDDDDDEDDELMQQRVYDMPSSDSDSDDSSESDEPVKSAPVKPAPVKPAPVKPAPVKPVNKSDKIVDHINIDDI